MISKKIFATIFTSTLLISSATAAELTVNTTDNSDTRDGALSLYEAILVSNGTLTTGTLDLGEVAQIDTSSNPIGTSDNILFDIAGTGPHTIIAPTGVDFGSGIGSSFPPLSTDNLTIDGYSQTGSSPNTNAILAPNNADIQIIIDARTFTSAVGENSLFLIFGDNITAQGIAFLGNLTQGSPEGLYGFYPANDGINRAENFHLKGSYVGLAPDGGGDFVYAGFQYAFLDYLSDGNHIVGTDGDGTDDRSEFNIFVGNAISVLVEDIPLTASTTIAGNFFNVLPDGLSSLPTDALNQLSREGDIVESGVHANLRIGTNSDGIADEDERNIIGVATDEFYEDYSYTADFPSNVVIAGNYIGVGIDGTTQINSGINEFMKEFALPFNNLRIGSNLDGVRDDIEANIISNVGELLIFQSNDSGNTPVSTTERSVSLRGNILRDNSPALGFFDGYEFSRAGMILGSDAVIPSLAVSGTTQVLISGSLPVNTSTDALVTGVEVDVYVAQAATVGSFAQPETYIGTFADNGGDDTDLTVGSYEFDVTQALIDAGFGGDSVSLLVTSNILGGDGVDTSPWSTPVAATVPASASVPSWELY